MREIPEDIMQAAREQCDLCGVTKYSDMRVHAEHIAAFAIMEDRKRCAIPAVRGLAVEIVDGVSGYTIENSPNRETHAVHYDMVENRLSLALTIPAGWKLVPVEPTDEMVERACRSHNVGWSRWPEPQKKTGREVMGSALRSAMLAGAATPEGK